MNLAKRIADRQRASRKAIEVAEWGEDDASPLTIYCGPLLAIEMEKIQRKHPNFFQSATIAGMVDLIILKAEDKDGEKVFTLDDKPTLMREEFSLIARIAGEMISSTSVEEHEKLKADPFRYNLIALADRLGRFIYEVEEISIDEYNEWVAYFKLDAERQKRGR